MKVKEDRLTVLRLFGKVLGVLTAVFSYILMWMGAIAICDLGEETAYIGAAVILVLLAAGGTAAYLLISAVNVTYEGGPFKPYILLTAEQQRRYG